MGKEKPEIIPEGEVSPLNRALDWFIEFNNRFGRFFGDFTGILCITFAVLTLLGLVGVSDGVILSAWVNFIREWVGWGSYLLALILGGAGIYLMRYGGHAHQPVSLSWGRIMAWEALAFIGLALLSTIGGGSLDRAQNGLDGGIVGWAIGEFPVILGLSPAVRTGFYAALFVLLSIWGLGLADRLAAWVDRQIQAQSPAYPGFDPDFVTGEIQPYLIPPDEEPATSAPQKQIAPPRSPAAVKLPPQFRKNFKVEAAPAAEPVKPAPRNDQLPPLNLLIGEEINRPDEKYINQTAGLIEKTMDEFGIPAKVVGFRIGPTVTQFAVEPGFVEKPGPDGIPQKQKVRVSQISGLSRDLALALSAERLRIEAPVPGRSYVGIEVPNSRSTVVRLRSLLESEAFKKNSSHLAIALGKDVSGQPVVADLAKMPHLLIAGTTGSGKSVCIEALTACLVTNNTPTDLRLVMVDPKMVELVRFNGFPHLYGQVETDLERILAVLRWALAEMDRRYRLLEQYHARDLSAYNQKMEKRKQPAMPRIVLLIDELADLMMSAPDQTEHSLVRLAQMARATGIHLVVATQRPSTDVVTGLIKANFPARIAFTVASSIDSRVILDTPGAEALLGKGDMLFLNPESGTPYRTQGVMVTDKEIDRLKEFWQKMAPPEPGETAAPWEELMNESETGDTLTEQAIALIRGSQHISTSLLQRKLRIGYPRAARLMDELEEMGVVGPSQGGGREREVLITPDDEENEDGDPFD